MQKQFVQMSPEALLQFDFIHTRQMINLHGSDWLDNISFETFEQLKMICAHRRCRKQYPAILYQHCECGMRKPNPYSTTCQNHFQMRSIQIACYACIPHVFETIVPQFRKKNNRPKINSRRLLQFKYVACTPDLQDIAILIRQTCFVSLCGLFFVPQRHNTLYLNIILICNLSISADFF